MLAFAAMKPRWNGWSAKHGVDVGKGRKMAGHAALLGKPKGKATNASRLKEKEPTWRSMRDQGRRNRLVTGHARKNENGQAWCAPRRQERKKQQHCRLGPCSRGERKGSMPAGACGAWCGTTRGASRPGSWLAAAGLQPGLPF